MKKVLKEQSIALSELLLCAEYTGQRTYPLSCVCKKLNIDLWLENPVQIKHFSGIARGRDDKLYARKIAGYAFRFQDKIRLFSLPEKHIASLKRPVPERDMYVSDKAKYHRQLTYKKRFYEQGRLHCQTQTPATSNQIDGSFNQGS